MVEKYHKKVIFFLILIIFLIALITLLSFFTPEEIVNKIGIRNAYILAFIVSFFGGFSAWGSISFIATLVTLSVGGLNPVYLGVIAGIALAIGDGIILYIGSKGREIIIGEWNTKINNFSKKIKDKLSGWTIPFITYLYMGLTPFPNDLILVFLALIEYPKKKLYAPIILGDLTFALLISIFAAKGILLFVS